MKMVGELDAGKPHVQFDEGAQETCDIAARLCPTLRKAPRVPSTAIPGFFNPFIGSKDPYALKIQTTKGHNAHNLQNAFSISR
jgi:hypothetical protein